MKATIRHSAFGMLNIGGGSNPLPIYHSSFVIRHSSFDLIMFAGLRQVSVSANFPLPVCRAQHRQVTELGALGCANEGVSLWHIFHALIWEALLS